MIISMKKILVILFVLISVLPSLRSQYSTLNAHSHNDYENEIPFRLAYNNHFGSVEADIWAVKGDLFVAHNEKDILPAGTLDSLYIQPIVRIFRQNKGKAWKDQASTFQLLIDLKTSVVQTLPLLVEKLEKYSDVFNPRENKNAIRIVITGNRPEPSEFKNYPGFVYFDGNLNRKYDKKQLKRIALYSENFKAFSKWNGSGEISEEERISLQNAIDSAHSMKKKIRFWNSPDNPDAWKTFMEMGIDFLNTDHITELAGFLNKYSEAF
jgi:alkaline phosphatase